MDADDLLCDHEFSHAYWIEGYGWACDICSPRSSENYPAVEDCRQITMSFPEGSPEGSGGIDWESLGVDWEDVVFESSTYNGLTLHGVKITPPTTFTTPLPHPSSTPPITSLGNSYHPYSV